MMIELTLFQEIKMWKLYFIQVISDVHATNLKIFHLFNFLKCIDCAFSVECNWYSPLQAHPFLIAVVKSVLISFASMA